MWAHWLNMMMWPFTLNLCNKIWFDMEFKCFIFLWVSGSDVSAPCSKFLMCSRFTGASTPPNYLQDWTKSCSCGILSVSAAWNLGQPWWLPLQILWHDVQSLRAAEGQLCCWHLFKAPCLWWIMNVSRTTRPLFLALLLQITLKTVQSCDVSTPTCAVL